MASKKIIRFVAMAALAGGLQAPAFAETDAQREACTPDALRLCSQFIPDAGRVESCLRSAGPRLSQACYVVFYPPQPAATAPSRSARMQAPPRQRSQLPDDDE